jgi:Flp pilus assembly protein CpaB
MSPVARRRRALLFALVAVVAAVLAAAITQGYGTSVTRRFGPLRPVVVAVAPIGKGRTIAAGDLDSALEVRRVPTRFIPSGAFRRPREAIGLQARSAIVPGSYLTASLLRPPRRERPRDASPLGRGRRAVQITVSGAEPLHSTGSSGRGATVDVVVTSEPTSSDPGRTYVAAARVPLLGLELAPPSPGPGSTAEATLGLTRAQALELIEAESFARQVTLLRSGP